MKWQLGVLVVVVVGWGIRQYEVIVASDIVAARV